MSHISILSAPLPSITRTSEDDAAYFQPCSSKQSLTVPDSLLLPRQSRSRANSIHRISTKHNPTTAGTTSLPVSPISTCFPQRPGFRRAYTSTAASSVSNSNGEGSRFDDLHYSQTHFSRSTLLVYPNSEVEREQGGEDEEDIRELLIASSDEESSAPPSTPGFESAKIPPRGSSQLGRNKQSMESEESTISLPEPITLLAPPSANGGRRNGYVFPRPLPPSSSTCI